MKHASSFAELSARTDSRPAACPRCGRVRMGRHRTQRRPVVDLKVTEVEVVQYQADQSPVLGAPVRLPSPQKSQSPAMLRNEPLKFSFSPSYPRPLQLPPRRALFQGTCRRARQRLCSARRKPGATLESKTYAFHRLIYLREDARSSRASPNHANRSWRSKACATIPLPAHRRSFDTSPPPIYPQGPVLAPATVRTG